MALPYYWRMAAVAVHVANGTASRTFTGAAAPGDCKPLLTTCAAPPSSSPKALARALAWGKAKIVPKAKVKQFHDIKMCLVVIEVD